VIRRTVFVLSYQGQYLTDLRDGEPVWTDDRRQAMSWLRSESAGLLLRRIPSIRALEGAVLEPVTWACADANYPLGWRLENA
jgi:hypothetical protein